MMASRKKLEDVMKIYLSCSKLYPIPYRGRRRFASQYVGKLP